MQAQSSAASTAHVSITRSGADSAKISVEAGAFQAAFNIEPIGFAHNLHELEIFQMDYLSGLVDKYAKAGSDYYLASGAPVPQTKFYSVPRVATSLKDTFNGLDAGSYRILLKRPEKHDPQFRKLLDNLFEQVTGLKGGLGNEKVLRLESGVFISSGSTTTPLHFDPEAGFFSQIEGEKFYHVYSPSDLSEQELERFYRRGVVDIAQIALSDRDPAREHVFDLLPGKGFHQPLNAPHWVQTGNARSISYSFVLNTDAYNALGRTRAFNHYMRKVGLQPATPGNKPETDASKSEFMRPLLSARAKATTTLQKAVGPARRTAGKMLASTKLYSYYKNRGK